jgi:hypothetical protein
MRHGQKQGQAGSQQCGPKGGTMKSEIIRQRVYSVSLDDASTGSPTHP